MAAHVFNNEDDQDDKIEEQRTLCIKNYGLDVLNSSFISNSKAVCPAIWDTILCWGNTAANTIASLPCPQYIAGFDRPNYATRQCMNNGQWYISPESNNTWTNYTQCFSTQYATVVMELPSFNATLIEEYMPIIKIISRIGYFVSFSTLLVAFCIMFLIKKLHCARNKLHMHLFASFIFRAATAFLKDILFIDGVGMSSDMVMKDGKSYFIKQVESNNWECKMFTSVWQYFITANYSWILMEGLYLHNLILLALFSDSNSSIKYYILLGWGLPALVVGPWIIARVTLDDNFCWTTHSNPSTFLIIRIPTMISNLINLVLFINIARVLLLKLRSPVSEEAKLYRRWARSTLVLVPLFGVHYALFLGMSYSMGINETIELIWLFCDQLFASFQGFFVAVLYCFLNGEVKTELKPHINNFVSTCLRTPFSICFNCGESSRSIKGRPSVCTTLSCSSLYNSTVAQKYPRKSRWDISQARHSVIHEKFTGNCQNCELNGKPCQDLSTCWNGKYVQNCEPTSALKCTEKYCTCNNGATQATEMTACLGNQEQSCKTEPPIDLEMITIANR